MDTIYALSSGRGRAGVAVIRVSGPAAGAVLGALTGRTNIEPRRALLTWLLAPGTPAGKGEKLDQALVLWFPGPASFTGEDVAEFHVHGGPAVIEGVLGAIASLAGTRPAEAGEFTRRAFDNGRLDLTAAEGIADLIDADTDARRRQALRQMGGALFSVYEDWRERLVTAMAYTEAGIDFADEDLPEDVTAPALSLVEGVMAEMTASLEDNRRGERIRDGIEVAILGEPNVGKSSLLNALARRDVAIVSDMAGTTRDMIEVHLDLDGYPVTLVDTAGLRTGGDVVEAEGIRRARDRATRADLRILMVEAAVWPDIPDTLTPFVGADSIMVVNKADRFSDPQQDKNGAFFVSAITGDGLDRLIEGLTNRVAGLLSEGDAPVITRARHRKAVEEARDHLRQFVSGGSEIELLAEELRLAARALGRITGRVDVEDILDVVFGSFCIGK